LAWADACHADTGRFSLLNDDVFIIYNNDILFQHVGFSRHSAFTFIDSNVSP
jgi:hypothetical protein